jgi:hypothetical protein
VVLFLLRSRDSQVSRVLRENAALGDEAATQMRQGRCMFTQSSKFVSRDLLQRFQSKDQRNNEMLDLISRLIDDDQWNEDAQEHFEAARQYFDQVDWKQGTEESSLRAMDRAYVEMELAAQMARPDLFALVLDGDSVSIKRTIH